MYPERSDEGVRAPGAGIINVSCLMRVLGAKFPSFARTASAPNCRGKSQVPVLHPTLSSNILISNQVKERGNFINFFLNSRCGVMAPISNCASQEGEAGGLLQIRGLFKSTKQT